ncbi:hypothetical protein VTH06DRAFT_5850 [Thermothelomyces fergusii]
MAPEANGNTASLTEEEVQRIQTTGKENARKRAELRGTARGSRQAKDAIGQETGAPTDKDKESIHVLAVGQSYPPCTTPLRQLQPMRLAELTFETHHRGRQLFVKRAGPVVSQAVRSWTIVQDEAEETERLEVVLHKTLHGKEILEAASAFIIKEPFFTLTEDGEPTLRIDHPSDLVVLHDAGKDDAALPPDISPGEIEKRALAHQQNGNAALGKNDLPLAHASYTAGLALAARLPTADLARDLHRSRARVNLLLGQFDEAKTDALAALIPTEDEGEAAETTTKHNAECYSRAGTAAYSLGRFAEAREFFERQQHLAPDDKGVVADLARCDARLREESSPTPPDLARLRTASAAADAAAAAAAAASGGRIAQPYRGTDAASWPGPTEVRDSPGKGRGLFATQPLRAGEVVLCEKAFVVARGPQDGAQAAATYDVRDGRVRVAPVGLVRVVVERAVKNPSLVGALMELRGWDDGGETGSVRETGDGAVVDVFRAHDIVTRNSFGLDGKDGRGGGVGIAAAGLWLRAAYMNHSCVPNVEREVIGDMLVVRAVRDVAAGEELFTSYDLTGDFEGRQEALMAGWGFECRCALCEAERTDDEGVREKRSKLAREADEFLKTVGTLASKRLALAKARKLVSSIDETYDEEKYRGLPRLANRLLQQWVAAVNRQLGPY